MESVRVSVDPTDSPLAGRNVPLTRTKRGTVVVDSCANSCPTQRTAITVAIRAMTQRMDFAPEFGVVRFRAGINSKIPDRRYVGATLYIPSSTPSTPAPAPECARRWVVCHPSPICSLIPVDNGCRAIRVADEIIHATPQNGVRIRNGGV